MKRLLIWSATLTLIFCLLVTSVRAIGGSIKSGKPTVAEMLATDSYLGPHGWCWRDICPEQTPLAQIESILRDDHSGLIDKIFPLDNSKGFGWIMRSDPYWTGSVSADLGLHNENFESIINRIDIGSPIANNANFRLGDAVRLFGDPISVYFCTPHYLSGGSPEFGGVIYFKGGVLASVLGHSSEVRVSLDTMIFSVTYYREHNFDVNLLPDPVDSWRGFTRQPVHGCGI